MSQILELPVDVKLEPEARDELNMRLLWIGKQLETLQTTDTGAAQTTFQDVRSGRLKLLKYDATTLADGSEFVETDTGLVYVVRSLRWYYLSGIWAAALGALPTPGASDAGLLFRVTDRNRTLQWSGSGWTFAPWEVIPAGFVTGFRTDPGTGWHVCDGSATQYLGPDGALHAVTLADFTTAAYPKWGSVADGFQAAVAPALTGALAAAAVQAGAGTAVVTGIGTLAVNSAGEPRHYDLIAYQRI